MKENKKKKKKKKKKKNSNRYVDDYDTVYFDSLDNPPTAQQPTFGPLNERYYRIVLLKSTEQYMEKRFVYDHEVRTVGTHMVSAQFALGLNVGAVGTAEGSAVGPVGVAVGAKVGPVGMNVTPAGNLSLGMAQDLRSDEKRSNQELRGYFTLLSVAIVCILLRDVSLRT